MKSYSPTNARKNFYKILDDVNTKREPIAITPVNGTEERAVVVVSKRDWDSMIETIYLAGMGEFSKAQERAMDHSGATDINNVDWDKL
ncbi:type II toxin-antitoxin system Phd/YefM family antitoxin [Lentilactobacillus sp. IMAU92037]|uniref:type II toxin-antitoxin system Phd/YefM family antitoxin n=1 Tax=Lentilactobacillus dabitei TaxID=2831523 RepID=UPI001C268B15|nr:type II toxin-antitoxin system Phd/YefM family antitoxin [Lentilactobacillus dabitei]MBU9790245.1 type II toxin-antitoxin system Phd/YefM family antitoxin [Lentilactobacillus dabitei]MBV0930347.1 type II toxin-antitoxin system Phd/YefM family antitoxin [Lentilactobacillus dabitei]